MSPQFVQVQGLVLVVQPSAGSTVSNPIATPAIVKPSEKVTITTMVTNGGETGESHTVTLKINGMSKQLES